MKNSEENMSLFETSKSEMVCGGKCGEARKRQVEIDPGGLFGGRLYAENEKSN
jgi:hypothetical protein